MCEKSNLGSFNHCLFWLYTGEEVVTRGCLWDIRSSNWAPLLPGDIFTGTLMSLAELMFIKTSDDIYVISYIVHLCNASHFSEQS